MYSTYVVRLLYVHNHMYFLLLYLVYEYVYIYICLVAGIILYYWYLQYCVILLTFGNIAEIAIRKPIAAPASPKRLACLQSQKTLSPK
jgi:hypothetical protein